MFVTVGNITLDLFISGLEKVPAFGGDEFTADNLTFCDEPLTMVLGGNGAISAYVLARLGALATPCGAIGQDQAGDIVAAWLTAAGVDMEGLRRTDEVATATTTVITDRALNRVAFHHPGTSHWYAPEALPMRLVAQADVLLVSSYPLLPRWRPDGFAQILRQARRTGTITALDIGPAIGQAAQLEELRPLLPHVNYLLCNGHELAVCTGAKTLKEGVMALLEAGAQHVVVKRGAQGAVLVDRSGSHLVSPGFAVEARFTVGAGDAFNAGLLYGVDKGWTPARALRFANAVAALVVAGARGALGAPSLLQVESFLARHAQGSDR